MANSKTRKARPAANKAASKGSHGKCLKRVLIANRGEIAVRIIRAAREIGIESVIVFSEADQGSLPVRLADKRILLPGSNAKETYLNQEIIVSAAIQCGADCVHPGYGFFAENADFALALREAGIKLIGPSAELIALMADKHCARERAIKAGLPVIPGTSVDPDAKQIEEFLSKVSFPVMVKAIAGGSGRGMRVIERLEDAERLIGEAKREGEAAFGNASVILEKFLENPRHIEVQVMGDGRGKALHFFERDCSIQRRHQKLVEEAPAGNLDPKLAQRIRDAAVRLSEDVGYEGAGTIEFLVENAESPEGNFYFLEMNTRIQVEHPVTEEVTGVDLLKMQFEVAAGKGLRIEQKEIELRGHAIEFRINCENPSADFKPATGDISYLSRPGGPGVREDSWVEAGSRISPYYDSLMSKLIVWAEDRETAISRAKTVLAEYLVEGVPTTLEFHRWLLLQEDFLHSDIDVTWLSRNYQGESVPPKAPGLLEPAPPKKHA